MTKSYFFCGIGGSGMLPLALIAHAQGAEVYGSDRARDQGNTPEKFTFFENQGITLFPQDGSGPKEGMTLIVSTAVEDTIPDVKAANDLGLPIVHRAALLAELFNAAETKIAVAGTSGKTTVTGMIGFALKELGKEPTTMNGGIFQNFRSENAYCSALTGTGGPFVTEADESDGSIALYNPDIALLNNVALDHKPMEELKPLFGDYLKRAKTAVVNLDNDGVRQLVEGHEGRVIGFGLEDHGANTVHACDIKLSPVGMKALVEYASEAVEINLQIPGEHNLSNALGAIAVLLALDIPLKDACDAISKFKGIKRRLETIGTKNGITVIDDFAHNPDKIAASLKSLKAFDGRLIIFFQPHGFGFLKLLYKELGESFSDGLDQEDILLLVDPYYAGGTVDRAITSKDLIAQIKGPTAQLCEDRAAIRQQVLDNAQKGDRIVIMGARDDTLSEFAAEIFGYLP